MSSTNLLLVEGDDDLHVFERLREYLSPSYFAIKNKKGIDNLIRDLPVEIKGSDIKNVGVVVDANTSLVRRWQSVCGKLDTAGYNAIPDSPDLLGTILQKSVDPLLPRVGLWIMPDNNVPGKLEDFLETLIPGGDDLLLLSKKAVGDIPQSMRKFSQNDQIKAVIHTWLAWQKKPGVPFGLAFDKDYFKADIGIAKTLVAWLQRLFGE